MLGELNYQQNLKLNKYKHNEIFKFDETVIFYQVNLITRFNKAFKNLSKEMERITLRFLCNLYGSKKKNL